MKYLIFIILLPINLFLLLLIKIFKKFLNIKFYKIRTERIGHLFFNTLLFIERKKKKIYHQNKKINFIIPYIDNQSIISNKYLLNIIKLVPLMKFFFNNCFILILDGSIKISGLIKILG